MATKHSLLEQTWQESYFPVSQNHLIDFCVFPLFQHVVSMWNQNRTLKTADLVHILASFLPTFLWTFYTHSDGFDSWGWFCRNCISAKPFSYSVSVYEEFGLSTLSSPCYLAYVSDAQFTCSGIHAPIRMPAPKAAWDWTCVIYHITAHNLSDASVIHNEANAHTRGGHTGCLSQTPSRSKRDWHHSISQGKIMGHRTAHSWLMLTAVHNWPLSSSSLIFIHMHLEL